MIHKIKHFVILSAIAVNFYSVQASTDQEAEKSLLIDELIQEHGFDEQYVRGSLGIYVLFSFFFSYRMQT